MCELWPQSRHSNVGGNHLHCTNEGCHKANRLGAFSTHTDAPGRPGEDAAEQGLASEGKEQGAV